MVSSRISAVMMTVLMIGIATSLVEAQSGTASCAAKLVPCADYINSTKPPASCCDSLKEAVTNELDCLCKLYDNPKILEQFRINVTQALQLPQHCGISNDISACKAAAPGSPGNPSPSATPGSGVGKIAWSGLSSVLLLWASVMFY